MRSSSTGGVIVYRRTGPIGAGDAIDEYSRRLTDAMRAIGVDVRYVDTGLSQVLDRASDPAWVLLQYNPFRYGRAGFAPGLLRDAYRLRRRSQARIAVMIHEAWVDIHDAKSALIGLWQRAQLRALLRLADRVFTSTEALAAEVGHGAVRLPIATNITPVPASTSEARERLGLDGKLTVALFGTDHPGRALEHAEAAVSALAEMHGPERVVVLNLGAGAPRLRTPAGVDVHQPGELPHEAVSIRLTASDIILLPFKDGVSTRRGTLMAALAHGRPVLGLEGRNTDTILIRSPHALRLTPVGDAAAYSRAVLELTNDRAEREALGQRARELYESQFDWPVLAHRVATELGLTSASGHRPREVVFVAHDVGGAGGMERVSEQLVRRLLGAGLRVTVIARTCTIEPSERLSFVRVRTPARPGTFGYPAFFAVASVLVARRRDALIHTTGAIIANRCDVSTVHYCHRAAAKVTGSRARRANLPYRLNSIAHVALSRAAERWCYRPSRARILCAVSSGVASELRTEFPAMADAVRAVANGVDSAVFRPDPAARSELRADLGIPAGMRLALFVGGDWERKGLAHAVDALANAPDWRLAIAGAGDEDRYRERARAAGAIGRVRFLGPVADMPRLYAAADAFVLPTSYEAFPLVALEAAASGLPLLITPVNGVEDLVQDGINGWFVTRDGRDIAGRLNALGSDPQRARGMAAAARAATVRFSWDGMADSYLGLYAGLTEGDR